MNLKEIKNLNDEQLIRMAKGGDSRAFSELVRRYEETVYRFSFKLCRDREKAEEVFQDTFVNVFRKLKSFDGRSKFSTWLYSIVANNCLMKQRRRKLEALEDPLEVLDSPPMGGGGTHARIPRWEETPADIVLNRELRKLLDASIQQLPAPYRAVFVLRDVEGKSTEETAKILHISIEAAKSRLRRARAFLREKLDPYMTSREVAT